MRMKLTSTPTHFNRSTTTAVSTAGENKKHHFPSNRSNLMQMPWEMRLVENNFFKHYIHSYTKVKAKNEHLFQLTIMK